MTPRPVGKLTQPCTVFSSGAILNSDPEVDFVSPRYIGFYVQFSGFGSYFVRF